MKPKVDLSRFVVDASVLIVRKPVDKGDYVGHPFRGNQWVDATGAARGGRTADSSGAGDRTVSNKLADGPSQLSYGRDSLGMPRMGSIEDLRARYGASATANAKYFKDNYGIEVDGITYKRQDFETEEEFQNAQAAYYGFLQGVEDAALNIDPFPDTTYVALQYSSSVEGLTEPFPSGSSIVNLSVGSIVRGATYLAGFDADYWESAGQQGRMISSDFAVAPTVQTEGQPAASVAEIAQRLAYGVTIHETAHALDTAKNPTQEASKWWRSRAIYGDPQNYSGRDVEALRANLATGVSEYGFEQRVEYVAEAFAAWFLFANAPAIGVERGGTKVSYRDLAATALRPFLEATPVIKATSINVLALPADHPVIRFAVEPIIESASVEKGDFVGHPFRGNQWVDANGNARGAASSGATDMGGFAANLKAPLFLNPDRTAAVTGDVDLEYRIQLDAVVTAQEALKNPWVRAHLAVEHEGGDYEAFGGSSAADTFLNDPNIYETALKTDMTHVPYLAPVLKAAVMAQTGADMRDNGITDNDVREAAAEMTRIIDEAAADTDVYFDFSGRELAKDVTVEEFAARVVNQWAATSNGRSPFSLAIQGIAADVLTPAVRKGEAQFVSNDEFLQEQFVYGVRSDETQFNAVWDVTDALMASAPIRRAIEGVVRSQYVRTQQYLERSGISSLTVYRGTADNDLGNAIEDGLSRIPEFQALRTEMRSLRDQQARDIAAQEEVERQGNDSKAAFLARVRTEDRIAEVDERLFKIRASARIIDDARLRPLSSWSSSESIASRFAQEHFVLKTTIPASNVFSLPLTGNGCLHEHEIVISAPVVRAALRSGADSSSFVEDGVTPIEVELSPA